MQEWAVEKLSAEWVRRHICSFLEITLATAGAKESQEEREGRRGGRERNDGREDCGREED